MRRLASLLVLLACCAGAAPAHAVSVSVSSRYVEGYRGSGEWIHHAVLVADAGERNDVAVHEDAETVVLHDAGAPLRAGAGCAQLDDRTARCSADGWSFESVRLELGDEDDRARDDLDGPSFVAQGGPGADELHGSGGSIEGGHGPDRLFGGGRHTTLLGGPDADELIGGNGPETLIGDDAAGPFAGDVIDGGPGSGDLVSYSGRRVAVRVDLSTSRGQGAPGEDDVVHGVEGVVGGDAADTLAGDDGPNTIRAAGLVSSSTQGDALAGRGGDDVLEGGPGGDLLAGGDGDDALEGGEGADHLLGGAGGDRLDAGSFPVDSGDVVGCGPGGDAVEQLNPDDVVGRDCEATRARPLFVAAPRRARRAYRVRVASAMVRFSCAVRVLVVRGASRVLASRWARVRRGQVLRVGRRSARPPGVDPAPRRMLRVVVQSSARCPYTFLSSFLVSAR